MISRNLLWTTFTVTVVLLLVVTISSTDARKRNRRSRAVPMAGVVGGTVRLICDLPRSSPPNVQWFDLVHNTGVAPQLIFTSADNDNRAIDDGHPKSGNFQVDADFTLTISGLQGHESSGKYICQSNVSEEQRERTYDLTVFDKPQCAGEQFLRSGMPLELSCQSSYSGNTAPVMKWFRLTERQAEHDDPSLVLDRVGETVQGVDDESDIDEVTGPYAKQVVRLTSRPDDDGAIYTCRMVLDQSVEECKIKLNVTYLPHHIRFMPHKEKVKVGEQVKCLARGNPAPTISLYPSFETETSGTGWRAFTVPQDQVGKVVTVNCTATSSLNGQYETLAQSITFHVIEPDHHAHDQKDHASHSTNPPQKANPVQNDQPANPAPVQRAGNNGFAVQSSHLLVTFLTMLFVVAFC